MRSGPGIAAAALGCVFLAHGPAQAQDAHLQGVLSGSVGFTDTGTASSAEDALVHVTEGFVTLSPGLAFSYETPRTSNSLSYTFTADFRFAEDPTTAITNVALWTGRFVTSPTTTLTLGASGTHGRVSTFRLTQAAGTTSLNPAANEDTEFLQGGVTEGFSKQFSPVLSATQAASFVAYDPLQDSPPPPRTYNATNTFGVQRLFRQDTAGLALTTAYTHFENISDPAAEVASFDDRDQLINTLVASWQHNFGLHFSSQLDAGVTHAANLNGKHEMALQPAGLAALRYTSEAAQAELAYSRAITLNAFVSQNRLTDQVTLRLAAPISHTAHLGAEGTTGFQYSRPIVASGDALWVLLADAALLWSPITPIPDLALSLRYQHATEFGTDAETSDDTRLHRNTFLFAISGAFPATTQPNARILMTQPFGSAGPEGQRKQQVVPSESTEEGAAPPDGAAQ